MRLNGDEMFDAYTEYREAIYDEDEPGDELTGAMPDRQPTWEARHLNDTD